MLKIKDLIFYFGMFINIIAFGFLCIILIIIDITHYFYYYLIYYIMVFGLY